MSETVRTTPILAVLFKDPEQAGAELAEAANAGDELAAGLLKQVTSRRGLTLPFLRQLRDTAQEVKLETTAELDSATRSFYWRKTLPAAATVSIDAAYAMVVIQLIGMGIVDRFQLCAADDCDRFYFGTLKQRYCSDTCGGRMRQRQKRLRKQMQE